MNAISNLLKKFLAVVAIALLSAGCAGNIFLPDTEQHPWQVMTLPTEAVFSDLAFTGNESGHGWLVGSRSSLFETNDGGKTWSQRELDLDQGYTFTSVDFVGDDGWVSGVPNILLHTQNGGDTWERVPLSEKLPGKPFLITALGDDSAEMATDVGAIYQTKDGGKNWSAMVEGAVGVVRNMTRSADGRYVAVSSRGNFYSTWAPGDQEWTPHNRISSRRLQNMGFDQDGKLWLIAKGGQLRFANSRSAEDFGEAIVPEFSTSWGLLDATYQSPEAMWVTGGGGNLLYSPDHGQTWFKDKSVGDVPSNFYRVVFPDSQTGFVLGQDGILLRFEGNGNVA
ncbi:photosystem II assembly protein [filamentous cyanobacterium CCP5]|nr:photosystem II assembly protein [filamentous cyanobacterium CCP5]